MNDHANKIFLKRKATMREFYKKFCDAVCGIRLIEVVKRYFDFRRRGFSRRAAFWMARYR